MMIYVANGDTYEHRETLKKQGWRWDPEKYRWWIAADQIKDEQGVDGIKRLSGVRVRLVDEDDDEEDDRDDDDDAPDLGMFV